MAELGIYVLSSLLGAGYLLNTQKKEQEKLKLKLNSAEHMDMQSSNGLKYNDNVVGTDIYNSRDYFKHKESEFNAVNCNWDASKQPEVSNIIPMYYNTLTVKDDYEKIPNANYDSKLILTSVKYLNNDVKQKIKKTSVNDGARNSDPDWGIVMDRPLMSREDGSDPLKKIGGSLIPDNNDFTHNNMVPFYKSSVTQDTRQYSEGKDRKLEIYTGQFKLNSAQKEEVKPHFAPMAENIYGSQLFRDLSRFNPNNTGKKHGEAPVEKIQVGPGLGQGYTNLPSGGKHETLRIMPKPIEQLRVDPVTETEGKTTSGGSNIAKRGLISQMYRNRSELLVENKKGERNFTTVGAITKSTSQPTFILRDTARKHSRQVMGSAKSTRTAHMATSKSKRSKKINFLNTSFRNNTTVGQKTNDYGKSSFIAYDNNRMSLLPAQNAQNAQILKPAQWGGTQTQTHVLSVTGPQAPKEILKDTVRKTRKEHYIKHARPVGNSLHGPSKAPSYNPFDWAMKKTVKETTENFNHLGGSAIIGAGALSLKGEDWVMKKTVKETTEDNNYIAAATVPVKKHIAWNPNEKARKTIKETTEDKKHIGVAVGEKHHKAGPSDVAKKTIKETTEDNNHKGNVSSASVKKGGGYATSKWTANNTNRQFTSDNEYTGTANANSKKTVSYDDAYNARMNENKEKIARGRKPTDKGPALGYKRINVEHKKLEDDRENKYVAVKTSTAGNMFNPNSISSKTNTTEKNYLPEHDIRLDVGILDAFKRNPLTQSLASWF
jgi:hypothetical protein